MSSAIVNGQRQPRIFTLLGYADLAIILATSTTGEGDDEEAKERKGRCKGCCHGSQRSSLFLI